jgi:hypothetical protein
MTNQELQVEETVEEKETRLAAKLANERRPPNKGPSPSETLQKKVLGIDQELRALGGREFPADQDPRIILPGVTSAVEALAMLKFGEGMVRVSYELTPGWTMKVKADVYGGINTILDKEDPEAGPSLMETEHLGGFKLDEVFSEHLGGVVVNLQKMVQGHLKEEIYRKHSDIEALEGALKAMTPEYSNLTALWFPTVSEEPKDAPKDEPPPPVEP